MSIFKRLGSQKFKHEFYITLHSIKGSLRNTYKSKIIWKRSKVQIGKKLSETHEFTISSTNLSINETLTMENTIYKKSSGFLEKEAKLQILVESKGNWVQFGTLSINLCDFIMKSAQEQEFSLKDCSEKDLKVIISIKTSYKESNVDETSRDDLLNQINNTKNELALLENKMDDVLQAKEISFNELLCLKQDFEEFKVKEKGESYELKEEM